MGRYIGPVCKKCRRVGLKLFLKGDRCYMAKCPIDQGAGVPGPHGTGRRPRLKDYGIQLQEKQRLRNMYGMREGQFRLFFARARRAGLSDYFASSAMASSIFASEVSRQRIASSELCAPSAFST